jgi:hypothetical protein
MLPFQRLLDETKGDGWPRTDVQLQQIVSKCGLADVADIVGWMEHLAAEKDALPDWDGDSSDDISNAQYLMAQLLLGLEVRFESEVSAALSSVSAETARWIDVARQMRGKS